MVALLAKSGSTASTDERPVLLQSRCSRAAPGADDKDGSFAASEQFALQSQDCWSLSSACLFARLGGSRGQMALDAAVGH